MAVHWLFVHILPSIGFILALALLSRILRERRSPTSTLAWLMAIIFIPYLGVPLYLIFGGRKMISKAKTKSELCINHSKPSRNSDIGSAYQFEPGRGIFPASMHNDVTLLPEGDKAYQAIIGLIEKAKRCVYVATFILGKDETGRAIVSALAKKASEKVEICLLLDALGSVRISKKFLLPLTEAGGKVAFFMPMFPLAFYLIIRIILWGKAQGYRWFNLGMAPFSGFENRALAPLWNRFGDFIFRHGEHFYNFQGLRHYKEKFDPVWQPKYLASPGGLALPQIFTNIATLVSGGMKGILAR